MGAKACTHILSDTDLKGKRPQKLKFRNLVKSGADSVNSSWEGNCTVQRTHILHPKARLTMKILLAWESGSFGAKSTNALSLFFSLRQLEQPVRFEMLTA